jgi:nucleotide-binding universal stress UspA family protein
VAWYLLAVSNEQPTAVILAGVAFDETGENALRTAVEMAHQRPHSALHIAHVLPESALASRTASIADHRELLATHPTRLIEFAARFLTPPLLEVVVHVRVGDPAEALLQLALDYDAKLLVVGTHGRRGLERLALGSVAQALLQAGRCPIVIAIPHQYEGMEKTRAESPECEQCGATRKASNDRVLWCKQHAKLHVSTSLRREGTEWVPLGGIDPGLVA